jgi:hypothetical protein
MTTATTNNPKDNEKDNKKTEKYPLMYQDHYYQDITWVRTSTGYVQLDPDQKRQMIDGVMYVQE